MGTKGTTTAKTTLTLDSALWQQMRIQAIIERRPFRDVIADACRLYLKSKGARAASSAARPTR
jgi:hypothetical protein